MNKVALITGAAQNIGKGISKKLLGDGYDCVLVDKNKSLLSETLKEFSSYSSKCYEYVADISDSEQIDNLIKWLKQENITVDVLINNAAHESQETITNLSINEINKSFQTNLVGPFYLTSLVTRNWINQNLQGKVIFLSSTHRRIIRTHPLYSASKAAIDMFMQEIALELAKNGIRINAIAPGGVRDTDELVEDYRTPLGFCMQPKDIAAGVAFLLSDDARFITGQTLTIDGGYSIVHTHHWVKEGRLPPIPKV